MTFSLRLRVNIRSLRKVILVNIVRRSMMAIPMVRLICLLVLLSARLRLVVLISWILCRLFLLKPAVRLRMNGTKIRVRLTLGKITLLLVKLKRKLN